MQVTNTVCVWAKNRDFENWPLNRGWPLNTGPLYTGSTVLGSQWFRSLFFFFTRSRDNLQRKTAQWTFVQYSNHNKQDMLSLRSNWSFHKFKSAAIVVNKLHSWIASWRKPLLNSTVDCTWQAVVVQLVLGAHSAPDNTSLQLKLWNRWSRVVMC